MGHPSTCMWILVATLTAGCVSERRDVGDAPLGVVEAPGEGGGAGDDGAGGGGGGDPGAEPRGEGDTCDDGDEQECIIDVGVQNGKRTCFAGSQRCRDGRWGPCHYVPGRGPDEG